jgi:hypothetical protein
MKIKVTEIECSAEELRQSNTVADGALNLIRNLFNGTISEEESDMMESEDQDD